MALVIRRLKQARGCGCVGLASNGRDIDGGLGFSSDGSGGGLWVGPLCGEAPPSIGGGISSEWHISKILDGAMLGQWWQS